MLTRMAAVRWTLSLSQLHNTQEKMMTTERELTLADLKEGDVFELVEGQFHRVQEMGHRRRIRWIEDNKDGTTTVCTTYCGHTYTMPTNTRVRA